MPNIRERFEQVRFSPETIRTAFEALGLPDEDMILNAFSVTTGSRTIRYDSFEEALADYRTGGCKDASFVQGSARADLSVGFNSEPDIGWLASQVECKAEDRATVERVLSVFAEAASDAYIPKPVHEPDPVPAPTVFIGHGGNAAWRDLKDHLHEQHGYAVEAYETGSRAGHTIRDILSGMTRRSSFAVLVMTGEDEQADGTLHARQNVVHEVGLFQGSLGFDRAIVLLEEGTEDFSNLQGIQQIRFDKGRIRETFGDVLATLRREFGKP